MKIAIITSSYPPQVGGVAEVARIQAEGFAARGHEVFVLTTHDPQRVQFSSGGRLHLREFKIAGNFRHNDYEGDITAYQDCLIQLPVDVMLFHGLENWTADVALPVLKKINARKILLSHGYSAGVWERHGRFPWGLAQWLRTQPYVWRLPKMQRAFDRLVFLSERRDTGRFLDRLTADWFAAEKIRVIPNGTSLPEFKKARPDFRSQHGITTGLMILNVANYGDRKNQAATLQDFFDADLAEATLVFIGGEPNDYLDHLKRLDAAARARRKLPPVLFLDRTPKPIIYAAYQAADVFISSARQETQPLATLDAMAAGIPFISTDVGCVREFPGGIVAGTGASTVQALRELANDSEKRKRLGEAGRKACADKYDWNRVLDAYEKLFLETSGQATP